MKSFYCGPAEWLSRLRAGRPVTATDYVTDVSLWTVEPIPRWDLARMHEILLCPECGRTNAPTLHAAVCSNSRTRETLRRVSNRHRERAAGHGRGCGCYWCTPPQPGVTPPEPDPARTGTYGYQEFYGGTA